MRDRYERQVRTDAAFHHRFAMVGLGGEAEGLALDAQDFVKDVRSETALLIWRVFVPEAGRAFGRCCPAVFGLCRQSGQRTGGGGRNALEEHPPTIRRAFWRLLRNDTAAGQATKRDGGKKPNPASDTFLCNP
jgi:hypothetical protein